MDLDRDLCNEEKESFLPTREQQRRSISGVRDILERVGWFKTITIITIYTITICLIVLLFTGILTKRDGATATNYREQNSDHSGHKHLEVPPGGAAQYFDKLVADRPYMIENPCGSTPEEALANGCKFDIISFCWQHPQCFDDELIDLFDGQAAWEWFTDADQTHPLTRAEVATGTFDNLHVNWEYHLHHCTAMWLKMHRAIASDDGKAAIDSYIGSMHHTHHCSQMLVDDRDMALSTMNTVIRIKYPHCGMV
ncbi:hypothetical protein F4777DRAFT_556466 [Nemania sp. FL0916]|nr:hypothetical protein F4777DRAFT_556466 [Nemania sp. FL0916]